MKTGRSGAIGPSAGDGRARSNDKGVRESGAMKKTLTKILGNSRPIQAALDELLQAAQHDINVLLQGEVGMPMEFIAHALHNAGLRRTGPFVAMDCRSLDDTEMAREFLALDAPTRKRRTANREIGSARGGTLFLDNVHALSGETQRALLKCMMPDEPAESDKPLRIRFIASAAAQLDQLVREGQFDSQLHAIMGQHVIRVPPLRERPEDVIAIAKRFLEEANIELRKSVRTFDSEAGKVLMKHSWPGNYPELWNVVYRATFAARDAIEPHELRAMLKARNATGEFKPPNLVQSIMRKQTQVFTPPEARLAHGQDKRSLADQLLNARVHHSGSEQANGERAGSDAQQAQ